MSIANVLVSPEYALVAVDTEGLFPDGSYRDVCKIICLPHIDAVMIFRGLSDIFACASPSIVGFAKTFDDLGDSLEEYLAGPRDAIMNHYKVTEPGPAELILVGYSPKAGRMVGHAARSEAGSKEIKKFEDFPSLFAPHFGPDVLRDWNVKFDRESMVRVAMDQCRRSREIRPADPIGGRLFLTEIRKGGMATEFAGYFPPRT